MVPAFILVLANQREAYFRACGLILSAPRACDFLLVNTSVKVHSCAGAVNRNLPPWFSAAATLRMRARCTSGGCRNTRPNATAPSNARSKNPESPAASQATGARGSRWRNSAVRLGEVSMPYTTNPSLLSVVAIGTMSGRFRHRWPAAHAAA